MLASKRSNATLVWRVLLSRLAGTNSMHCSWHQRLHTHTGGLAHRVQQAGDGIWALAILHVWIGAPHLPCTPNASAGGIIVKVPARRQPSLAPCMDFKARNKPTELALRSAAWRQVTSRSGSGSCSGSSNVGALAESK